MIHPNETESVLRRILKAIDEHSVEDGGHDHLAWHRIGQRDIAEHARVPYEWVRYYVPHLVSRGWLSVDQRTSPHAYALTPDGLAEVERSWPRYERAPLRAEKNG